MGVDSPCPRCKAAIYRIPRRLADRAASLLLPVRRYRCSSWACGWEGNLRYRNPAVDAPSVR